MKNSKVEGMCLKGMDHSRGGWPQNYCSLLVFCCSKNVVWYEQRRTWGSHKTTRFFGNQKSLRRAFTWARNKTAVYVSTSHKFTESNSLIRVPWIVVQVEITTPKAIYETGEWREKFLFIYLFLRVSLWT